MAKKSLMVKSERSIRHKAEALAKEKASPEKEARFTSRAYTRCKRCGRSRGYMRKFQLCRICFRELASEGKIPGVVKASW